MFLVFGDTKIILYYKSYFYFNEDRITLEGGGKVGDLTKGKCE